MSSQAVSYWLLPGPKAQIKLDQLSVLAFERISFGLGVCMLPPHITLYSHPLDAAQPNSQEQIIDRLQQLADSQHPVLLYPKAIEATRMFTQSFVLRFNSEALADLHPWFLQLCLSSPNELGYKLDPHLSLLYSQAPLELRRERAKGLVPPTDPLLFESVSVVSHPLKIETPADIAACTTLHECSLVSSA